MVIKFSVEQLKGIKKKYAIEIFIKDIITKPDLQPILKRERKIKLSLKERNNLLDLIDNVTKKLYKEVPDEFRNVFYLTRFSEVKGFLISSGLIEIDFDKIFLNLDEINQYL